MRSFYYEKVVKDDIWDGKNFFRNQMRFTIFKEGE